MKKLNFNSPVGGTGYGITSLNILKELYKKNIDISLFPIGFNMSLNTKDEIPILQKLLKNSNTFDYNAPCLKIWHQNDLAGKIGSGDYYTFPFFEVDKLVEREIHHLNFSDVIFTATDWSKQILLQNNVTRPIVVAPLGVDAEIFNYNSKIRLAKNSYIFMHVGKFEKRKSQDFLLQCFELAFNENDNVELWLMPFGSNVNENQQTELSKLLETNSLKDKIKIYRPVPTQIDLAHIINEADCGIFLSRAEGWNNEIIEFMAMNKPIITTNYSAHTHYCNSQNSYLVDIDETEPAIDNVWFFGEGNWAKLGPNQIEQTVEYMKFVYKNNISMNPKGLETAKQYSWNNTATIIDQTLEKNGSYNAPA